MCVHVYLSREGLEIFGVVSAVHSFPEAMKPAFVSSGVILAEDVLNIRSVKPSAEVITENETRVYGYFRNFIHQYVESAYVCAFFTHHDMILVSYD